MHYSQNQRRIILHVISILVTAVAFGVVLHAVPSYAKTSPAVEDDSIRPFHINIDFNPIGER